MIYILDIKLKYDYKTITLFRTVSYNSRMTRIFFLNSSSF